MSGFLSQIQQTPFHAQTAAHNSGNLWCMRGGFTVPVAYGDPVQEVLAGHVSAVLCDVSAEQRLRLHGAGVDAAYSDGHAPDLDRNGITRAEYAAIGGPYDRSIINTQRT